MEYVLFSVIFLYTNGYIYIYSLNYIQSNLIVTELQIGDAKRNHSL